MLRADLVYAKRMAKPTKKHKSFFGQHSALIITLATTLVASILFLAFTLYFTTRSRSTIEIPPLKSQLAYVDGGDAVNQVANFYKQYIDPSTSGTFRSVLIKGYGDKNLSFYSQYYLHGFDPITCSSVMPAKVTASLVSTGPVAKVNAKEYFSDGTKLTINTTVVLSDKLAIDSVTCPGSKGNLPPISSL